MDEPARPPSSYPASQQLRDVDIELPTYADSRFARRFEESTERPPNYSSQNENERSSSCREQARDEDGITPAPREHAKDDDHSSPAQCSPLAAFFHRSRRKPRREDPFPPNRNETDLERWRRLGTVENNSSGESRKSCMGMLVKKPLKVFFWSLGISLMLFVAVLIIAILNGAHWAKELVGLDTGLG